MTYEDRMKTLEEQFDTVKAEIGKREKEIADLEKEALRMQGEYRLLVELKKEEDEKNGVVTMSEDKFFDGLEKAAAPKNSSTQKE